MRIALTEDGDWRILLKIILFNMISINLVTSYLYISRLHAEGKHTPVGRKIQVLKYLTLGVELTIFFLPVHAYMNHATIVL